MNEAIYEDNEETKRKRLIFELTLQTRYAFAECKQCYELAENRKKTD